MTKNKYCVKHLLRNNNILETNKITKGKYHVNKEQKQKYYLDILYKEIFNDDSGKIISINDEEDDDNFCSKLENIKIETVNKRRFRINRNFGEKINVINIISDNAISDNAISGKIISDNIINYYPAEITLTNETIVDDKTELLKTHPIQIKIVKTALSKVKNLNFDINNDINIVNRFCKLICASVSIKDDTLRDLNTKLEKKLDENNNISYTISLFKDFYAYTINKYSKNAIEILNDLNNDFLLLIKKLKPLIESIMRNFHRYLIMRYLENDFGKLWIEQYCKNSEKRHLYHVKSLSSLVNETQKILDKLNDDNNIRVISAMKINNNSKLNMIGLVKSKFDNIINMTQLHANRWIYK